MIITKNFRNPLCLKTLYNYLVGSNLDFGFQIFNINKLYRKYSIQIYKKDLV